MSEKRFVCIDIGYGDEWYITDNGKRLSEMEIMDLLNNQQTEITELRRAIDYLKTVIRYTIPNQMVADVFKYIGEDYE